MAGAPRAASRFEFRGFISVSRTIARGVTAMVVGSGALLGGLGLLESQWTDPDAAVQDAANNISHPTRRQVAR